MYLIRSHQQVKLKASQTFQSLQEEGIIFSHDEESDWDFAAKVANA